jgi:sugar lactone lactonase YvrE
VIYDSRGHARTLDTERVLSEARNSRPEASMRALILAGICLASAWSPGAAAQQGAAGCAPLGRIEFLCAVVSPEDFAVVPGTDWILTSGNRAGQGAIRVLNVRDQTITTLYPTQTPKVRPDARTYPGCPGPLDPADPVEKKQFAAHGLYLKPGPTTTHTLLVVHHGSRESIEVFEVDAAGRPPTLTWVGCVVAPPTGRFNAVVALPDGGMAATNVPATPGRQGGAASGSSMGAVWEWHAGAGWKAVAGSEADRINGLEISKDGKWYYIAAWGDQAFVRLPRGQSPAKRDVLPMPFRIDNLRLMPDGSILSAGHGGTALCSCPTETWHIGRIDPDAMRVQELVRQPYVEGFGAATVAVQVGETIWIGTNRGDRIGRFPAR